MIRPSDPEWPSAWDTGCVLCGEPRLPASAYCEACIRGACEHCGVVHDTRGGQCQPPTNERNR